MVRVVKLAGYAFTCAGLGVAILGLVATLSLFLSNNISTPEPRDFYIAVAFGGLGFGVAGWTQLRLVALHGKLDELLKTSRYPRDALTASVSPVTVSGNASFKVSGAVIAASGNAHGTTVSVRVTNPTGTTVAAVVAMVTGSGASGAYTTTIRAGGNANWASGRYGIVAAYGTSGGEAPSMVEVPFDYLSAPRMGPSNEPRAAEAVQEEPTAPISEKWASTLEEWTREKSIGELYVSLGCHMRAIETAVDKYLRLYFRNNVGVLGIPEDATEHYRKKGYDFLKANWSGVRKEACDWSRKNSGVVGQASIVGLAPSLALALPPPWNEYPSVGALIATILVRGGLDATCSPGAQPPEPVAE
jgi:hypothetical protein